MNNNMNGCSSILYLISGLCGLAAAILYFISIFD